MDIVLLHNANAGDESHTEKKLIHLLQQHGHKVKYAPVNKGIEDDKLLRKADLVVAAGGDGTIRKTITRLAGTSRPVGILPLGTANNIARSLGIGSDIAEIVAGWEHAKPRDIDLGIAKGPWGQTWFIEGVGFGLVGRTMAILDEFDARSVHAFATPGDKLHRDVAVFTALTHEMSPIKAQLRIGKEKIKDKFLLLEVLNISRAGPGFVLAAHAKPDDGEFNVVSVLGNERTKLIDELVRHIDGQREGAKLRDRPAKKLELEVGPCEFRIDDKICLVPEDFLKLSSGKARIELRIEPGAAKVLC